MTEYAYEGPVKSFDTIVKSCWRVSTFAPSEKKARSNLAYRYKKAHGLAPAASITLPGKLTIVG